MSQPSLRPPDVALHAKQAGICGACRMLTLEVQLTVLHQVLGAGIQAASQHADPPHDEIVLGRLLEPDGDLRLPHRQAEFPGIGDQLHHDVRVPVRQRGYPEAQGITTPNRLQDLLQRARSLTDGTAFGSARSQAHGEAPWRRSP